MKLLTSFVFFSLLGIFEVTSLKSYRDHKVVQLEIENEEQLNEIKRLEFESGFSFWDSPTQLDSKFEIIVHPEKLSTFEEIASAFSINFKITATDFQSVLDGEKPIKRSKAISWDQYNELDDIMQFLDDMSASHSDVASVFTIGESFEGRPLRVMKISTNDSNPAVFIESNIHAREWITSATTTWIINEMLTSEDPAVRAVVDRISWFIIPVVNPDGLQYSKDEDRLWRRTRSNHNIFCPGADPNRNFAYNWMQGGSTRVACNEMYAGPSPFSEQEIVAVMNFYVSILDRAEAYISFHAPREILVIPWGTSNETELIPNVQDLLDIAEVAVDALKEVHGTVYRYGNLADTLYVASGTSLDHAYGALGTQLSFSYEFRAGKSTGSIYILPPDEIIPNSEEVFYSLMALIRKSVEIGYFQPRP